MSPVNMLAMSSVVSSAAALLLLVLCCAPCVCGQLNNISFSLSTKTAPWAARALTFSCTAYGLLKSDYQSLPLIAGGAQSIGLIDSTSGAVATNYLNDVWVALDPLGQAWKVSTVNAPWSARSSGGLINVALNLVNPAAGLQILVLVGGRQGPASSDLLNDVWSSTNNGEDWSKLNQTLQTAFSPRENFGLVVAGGFDNSSTRYAYLLGGFGLPSTGGSAAPQNDVYYTRGMGTMPWLPLLTGSAPWSPRYAFGVASTTGSIFIAGGITTSGASNEVWSLQLQSLVWMRSTPFLPPASGYSALIQASLRRNTAYLVQFAGTDFKTAFNNVTNNAGDQVLLLPAYQPTRLQYTTIYTPVPTPVVVILGGIAGGASLQDVWSANIQLDGSETSDRI